MGHQLFKADILGRAGFFKTLLILMLSKHCYIIAIPRHIMYFTLSFVFSACGEIRTDFKLVSTALLSRAGLGHIGKERLLVSSPLEDCLTGLTGSSTLADCT